MRRPVARGRPGRASRPAGRPTIPRGRRRPLPGHARYAGTIQPPSIAGALEHGGPGRLLEPAQPSSVSRIGRSTRPTSSSSQGTRSTAAPRNGCGRRTRCLVSAGDRRRHGCLEVEGPPAADDQRPSIGRRRESASDRADRPGRQTGRSGQAQQAEPEQGSTVDRLRRLRRAGDCSLAREGPVCVASACSIVEPCSPGRCAGPDPR